MPFILLDSAGDGLWVQTNEDDPSTLERKGSFPAALNNVRAGAKVGNTLFIFNNDNTVWKLPLSLIERPNLATSAGTIATVADIEGATGAGNDLYVISRSDSNIYRIANAETADLTQASSVSEWFALSAGTYPTPRGLAAGREYIYVQAQLEGDVWVNGVLRNEAVTVANRLDVDTRRNIGTFHGRGMEVFNNFLYIIDTTSERLVKVALSNGVPSGAISTLGIWSRVTTDTLNGAHSIIYVTADEISGFRFGVSLTVPSVVVNTVGHRITPPTGLEFEVESVSIPVPTLHDVGHRITPVSGRSFAALADIPVPTVSVSPKIGTFVRPGVLASVPIPSTSVQPRVTNPRPRNFAVSITLPAPSLDNITFVVSQPGVRPFAARVAVPAPIVSAQFNLTYPIHAEAIAYLPAPEVSVTPVITNPVHAEARASIPAPVAGAVPVGIVNPTPRAFGAGVVLPAPSVAVQPDITPPLGVRPQLLVSLPVVAPRAAIAVDNPAPRSFSARLVVPGLSVAAVAHTIDNPPGLSLAANIPMPLPRLIPGLQITNTVRRDIAGIGPLRRTHPVEVGRQRRVNAMIARMPYRMIIREDPLLRDEQDVQDNEPNDARALLNTLWKSYQENTAHVVRCDFSRQFTPARIGGREPTDEPSHRINVIVPGMIPQQVRVTDIATIMEIPTQELYTIINISHDRLGYSTTLTLEEYGHRSAGDGS